MVAVAYILLAVPMAIYVLAATDRSPALFTGPGLLIVVGALLIWRDQRRDG